MDKINSRGIIDINDSDNKIRKGMRQQYFKNTSTRFHRLLINSGRMNFTVMLKGPMYV